MVTSRNSRTKQAVSQNNFVGASSSARRRTFHSHIQAWAYDHFKRSGGFQGWITTTHDSEFYALRKPVACLVKPLDTDTTPYTKVHLKLFRRRRARPVAGKDTRKKQRPKRDVRSKATAIESKADHELEDYYAIIKSGSSWVSDVEWFAEFTGAQLRQQSMNPVPYRLRSKSSAAQPSVDSKDSKATRIRADKIDTRDWVRLGQPFSLLELPKEVRLQIFDYVLQLPKELIFDGCRQNIRGRDVPRLVSHLRNFRSCTFVPSHQFHYEVSHLLYSTTSFTFQSIGTFIDFLSHIGKANRQSVRKICLQLEYYDYFDIFTPEWLVKMLDVPVWSRNRSVPRTFLSEMKLERLAIRLKELDRHTIDGDKRTEHRRYVVRDLRSIDKLWVYESVQELCPRATFESDTWPHCEMAVSGKSPQRRWDSLIHAAHDDPKGSFLGLWLDRTPKSVFLRAWKASTRKGPCAIGCTITNCRGECTESPEICHGEIDWNSDEIWNTGTPFLG